MCATTFAIGDKQYCWISIYVYTSFPMHFDWPRVNSLPTKSGDVHEKVPKRGAFQLQELGLKEEQG
jgi:hypothetical protein